MSFAVAARAPAAAAPRPLYKLLGAAIAMVVVTAFGSLFLWNGEHYWLTYVVAIHTLVYAAAVFLLTRPAAEAMARSRFALLLILATALAMRLLIVPTPPVSTDIYRYIWDGRTQSHGINPYRYVPADPALEQQRGGDICPPDTRDAWSQLMQPRPALDAWSSVVCRHVDLERWRSVYQSINRVDYLITPYLPTSQIVFLAATRFGETVPVMKAAMVLVEFLTIWGLFRLMRRRGIAPGRILLYAWNPLVVWEIAGSGHTEAIGMALMVLAMVASDAGKRFLSGLLLGAAALTKPFPLASAPAIYRRWDWRMPLGLLVAVVVLCAPYVSEWRGLLSSLVDYADEVGAASGTGVFLISWIAQFVALSPSAMAIYWIAGLALLLVAGLVVVMRRHPERAAPVAALVLVTCFQLVLSPHYPWYLTWAVPFLCFRISTAVIWMSGVATLFYEFVTPVGPLLYAAVWGPFLLLAVVDVIRGLRGAPMIGGDEKLSVAAIG